MVMKNQGVLYLAGAFILCSILLALSLIAVVSTQDVLNRIRELNNEQDRYEQQLTDIECTLSQLNTAQNILELYVGISPIYEWREQELLGSVRLMEKRLWAARQIIWEGRGYTLRGTK